MNTRRAICTLFPILLVLASGQISAAPETPSAGRRAALDSSAQPRSLSAPAQDPVQGGVVPRTVEPAENPQIPATPGTSRDARGNPLWAIPLRSLNQTRERPIFSPSRRPPPPAVAGPPPVETAAPPPPPAGPDRPRLSLVGAVAGESEGIAIFLDQATNDIVRLRTGETHPSGWTLRSVKGREATLQKERESVILALPAPSEQRTPGTAAPPPGPEREL
jgi:general secretion pathway protein N